MRKRVAWALKGITGAAVLAIVWWQTRPVRPIQPFLVLSGHRGCVRAVSFSPDDRLLATGSEDRTVKLWELDSGRLVRTLPEPALVSCLAFSPDGRWLAVGMVSRVDFRFDAGFADGIVALWDTRAWRCRRILKQHWRRITALAFFPDARLLADAGSDGAVKVWDVNTGRARQTYRLGLGIGWPLSSVAVSSDGKLLAASLHRGGLTIWDRKTGQELQLYTRREQRFGPKGFASIIESIAFSPDGKRLAIGGWARISGVWDITTGRQLPLLRVRSDDVRQVAFSPDGRLLARGGRDGLIRLWNADTGVLVATPVPGTPVHLIADIDSEARMAIRSMAFSHNGRVLAAGSNDAGVRLWRVLPTVRLARR